MSAIGHTIRILLCLIAVAALSGRTQAAQCPAKSFDDSAAMVAACTARLGEPRLSSDDRVHILLTRGRALHAMGRMADAALDYDQAIALASDPTDAHVWRGFLAYSQSDWPIAITHAVAALEKKPDFSPAWALLGSIKRALGDFPGSKEAYDKAIADDPNDGLYHYQLFMLLQQWAHDREALQESEVILRLPAAELDRPRLVNSMDEFVALRAAIGVERGKQLGLMGRFEDAEKAYDDAVAATPSALTYAMRADFHISRDAPNDVIQPDIDKALALEPGFWLGHAVQAEADRRLKKLEPALAEYRQAAALNPTKAMLRWRSALMLRELDRLDEATAEALAALQINASFLRRKVIEFQHLGYLHSLPANADPMPAIRDAVQACMLDSGCS
jgi:tetratricopeptide (TPR) repeat protein